MGIGRGGLGIGGGGGGLHFRDPPDIFSSTTLALARADRDTAFASGGTLAAVLNQFQGDQSLAIILRETTGSTQVFETYLPGNVGDAYESDQWVERIDAVQGDKGDTGSQARFTISIFQNAATAPTTPTGGSYVVETGVLTAPTGWTVLPTAPGATENIYESQVIVNPRVDSGTLTPVWSVPVEPPEENAEQAALAAQVAAEAARDAAQTFGNAAETDATAASASETAAAASATAAATAQTDAETAETNAESAETNAETAQTLAENARDAAETALASSGTALAFNDLWSGDIDITTANQWKALGTVAVPSNATWLIWNGGKASAGADDGPAALSTWINAAAWRALTVDTVDTTPGDGTGMLMVDWIATNIGDGTPDFARRDAVIGRTSGDIPLITSTNTGEDFYGASLKYITQAVSTPGGTSDGVITGISLANDGTVTVTRSVGADITVDFATAINALIAAAGGTNDGVITGISLGADGMVTVTRSVGNDITEDFSTSLTSIIEAATSAVSNALATVDLPTPVEALVGRVFNTDGTLVVCRRYLQPGHGLTVDWTQFSINDDISAYWTGETGLTFRGVISRSSDISNPVNQDVYVTPGGVWFRRIVSNIQTGWFHFRDPHNWIGEFSDETDADGQVTADGQIAEWDGGVYISSNYVAPLSADVTYGYERARTVGADGGLSQTQVDARITALVATYALMTGSLGVSDLPSAVQNAVRSLSYSTANPQRLSYVEVDGGTSAINLLGLAALNGATFTGATGGIAPVNNSDFVTLEHFNANAGGSGMVTDDIYFGTSDDAIPEDAEFTIPGVNGSGLIASYTGAKHHIIARLDSEADITRVIYSDDASQTNQIGGFTKYGSFVTPTGESEDFNAWVSNQALTQAADVTITVS